MISQNDLSFGPPPMSYVTAAVDLPDPYGFEKRLLACASQWFRAHLEVEPELLDKHAYPLDSMEHVLWAQLMGAVTADVNVFNSDHCQSMLMDNAKALLSKESCAEITKRSERLDYGPLEGDLQPVDHDVDVPVIAYNHRLQGYKKWRDTFAVLKDLYDEGVKFTVRYMNNTGEHLLQSGLFRYIRLQQPGTQLAIAQCPVRYRRQNNDSSIFVI